MASLLVDIYKQLSCTRKEKPAWKFYRQIPGFATYQLLSLFVELWTEFHRKEELDKAVKELPGIMEHIVELQEHILISDHKHSHTPHVRDMKAKVLGLEQLRDFHWILKEMEFKTGSRTFIRIFMIFVNINKRQLMIGEH